MLQYYESIFYNILEELNATYKPNHSDILRMEKKYGTGVQFSRIMHRKGIEPRFELGCFKIVEGEKSCHIM